MRDFFTYQFKKIFVKALHSLTVPYLVRRDGSQRAVRESSFSPVLSGKLDETHTSPLILAHWLHYIKT